MADQSNNSLLGSSSSDSSSLWGALSGMLRAFELRSDQLLPARVVAFDRNRNLATVQPLIMWLDMNDTKISRHQIAEVPVLSLGGGLFHVSFPLNEGDLGWIYAADRDLSLFKQSLAESIPNTGRAHRFEDSMFVPDVFRNYTINGDDASAMVIQSTDGSVRVSLRNDNIHIEAPSKVTIKTSTAELDADVKILKTLEVTGMTNVNGGFSATGGGGSKPCDLPPTTTVAGKQVDGHVHGGVLPGGADTDPF